MALTKEQKRNKGIAELLLRAKGIDYDTWLDQQHQAIIGDSQDVLMNALQSFAELSKNDQGANAPIQNNSEVNNNN